MKSAFALAALPAAFAVVHEVTVGKDGDDLALKFSPEVVNAAVGDQVVYTFFPMHDVAQAPFGTPCVPGNTTFYSGRLPFTSERTVASNTTYTVDITDTTPKWLYCTTARHCQDGMVGVINPPANSPNTLDAFRAAAANAPENVRPNNGQQRGGVLQLVAGEGEATVTGSAAPTAAPTGAVPYPSGGADPYPSGSANPYPSGGAANPYPTEAGAPAPTDGGAIPTPTPPEGAAAGLPVVGSSTVLAVIAGVAAWFL